MLVAGGAPLDVTDNKGLTPKLLAIQNDDHELASYFESKFYVCVFFLMKRKVLCIILYTAN